MFRKSTLSILSLLIFGTFLCPSPVLSQSNNWLGFSGGSGFRIEYPKEWFKIDIKSGGLFITSSEKRSEGTIIPKGAQMISVHEGRISASDIYLESFKAQNPDDQILSYKKIEFSEPNDGGCKEIYVLESTDEIGPNIFYLENNMYCPINGRLFILNLTQWKADPFSDEAYNVAIQMLKSLRIS